jgi:mono/diheme cytochrome c family protein
VPELPDITVYVLREIQLRSPFLLVAASLLVLACGPSRSPRDPEVQAEARRLWQDRCANCHGPTGNADGPQARHLLVAPRRLSDPGWRATVTDDHLRTVILEGGAAVGLSPVMAANPDLRSRPEVLDALVEHLRSLPAASS